MKRSLFPRGSLQRGGARNHAIKPEVTGLERRRLLSGDEGLAQVYGQLPLSFEANQGQTDSQVGFLARGDGYALFLTPTEAVLRLQTPTEPGTDIDPAASDAVLRMQLVGANTTPRLLGLDRLPGTSNYLIGNDPSRWHTDIANYARVEARGVYPGVDLVYYGNQRQLEYDFTVAPGADPEAIRLAFPGAESATLDDRGNLVLQTAGGAVVQQAPVLYQEADGVRQAVSGHYVLEEVGQIGFAVGSYDRSRPLVIDPILTYSTYFGGSSYDFGNGIAVDSTGAAYVTGYASSTNFPTASSLQAAYGGGAKDAFVAKLNPAGTALIYSTYLGGSSDDVGTGIAVDAAGAAYVTGYTLSTNFATANPLQAAHGGSGYDAFVAKLNPAGTALIYSTYLGGFSTDEGKGIAVDAAGAAYVTGDTYSTSFPIRNPLQAAHRGGSDVFVTKLNPAGTALVYSTYLGGSSTDSGSGIAVDAAGAAYVTGVTYSTNLPTANPLQAAFGGGPTDAFVAKLNPAGSALVYSTYLGGSNFDVGYGIAVDAAGAAYVTGYTSSTNFPIANPLQATHGGGVFDAFVAKLNPAGSALAYSTYLGGSAYYSGYGGPDTGRGIAVDAAGAAYVTGYTTSDYFPTVNPLQATNRGGGNDAFVAKLNPAGSALVYSTYLGGSSYDEGRGIAVDAAGAAYVTGFTLSTNFPTASPLQTASGGNQDAFVAKLLPGQANNPPIVATSAGALSYTENALATAIDPGLTVNDSDSPTLVKAIVAITSGFAVGQDVLGFINTALISGGYNASTGVLTLTGTATVALYQAALRSVTYRNNSDNPSTLARTVTFTADDGGTSNNLGSATRTVNVTAVNDAPVLTGANSLTTITEDQVANGGNSVTSLISGRISDVDGGALQGIAITAPSITGGGTWQYSIDGGTNWAAIGAVSAGGALLLGASDRVRFFPDGQNGTTGSITVRAWDQTSGSVGTKVNTASNGGNSAFSVSTATAGITVTAVNDPPRRTAGASPGLTLLEGSPALTSLGLTGLAYDPVEAGQSLTYRVNSLPPAALGTIRLADGTTVVNTGATYTLSQIRGMQFLAADADANGGGTLSWTVTDDGGTTNSGQDTLTESLTITVTAVNDAPTLDAISPVTIPVNSGRQSINLAGILAGGGESQTLSVTATSDNTGLIPNPTVTYTSPGATGSFSFTPAADQTGSATITVIVTDNGGTANGGVDRATRTFAVTVTPANRSATITTLTAAPNPSTYGQSVTFTAIVAVVGPGTGTPTGTATFMDGSTTLGTGTLNAGGVATFSTSTLSAGPHTITAVYGGDSSKLGSTGTLPLGQTVNKATPTITWIGPAGITYGTAMSGAQLNAAASFNGSAVPGSVSYTPAANTVLAAGSGQALSVTFTPANTSNYNSVTRTVTIDVAPAPLTITVDNSSKTYGQVNPAFSVSYSGFVNNDSPASLGGALSYSTPATSASHVVAVGYPVTAGGLASSNYSIRYIGGTLTVTPAPLTITANDKSMNYGGVLPPLTPPRYAGLVNGDTQATFDAAPNTAPTLSTVSPDSSPGTYPINASGAFNPDYTISYASGALTINTPAAADLSVAHVDAPDPATVGQDLTYTLTVTNAGPSSATGVTLTDTLPAGVTFVSTSHGSFIPATGAVAASLGTMASDTHATVTIVVRPTAAGTIVNSAVVSGDEADPAAANNTATGDITVLPRDTTPPPRDTTPPLTRVVSVHPLPSGFSIRYEGTDAGGSGLAFFALSVQMDGGSIQPFERFHLGTLGNGGVYSDYSGSTEYHPTNLIAGEHAYRFFSVGLDNSGNLELAPTDLALDVVVTATFSIPAATVTAFGAAALRGTLDRLGLTFDAALDAVAAGRLDAYRLVSAGRDRRFGTRDDRTLRLRSARFDPANLTLVLTPRGKVTARQPLRLTVDPARGLLGLDGQPIDGDGDGQPGGLYEVTFGAPARGGARRPGR